MDLLGLKNLPAETRPIIEGLMARVDGLETQAAKDANVIADKLIAAITPKLDAVVEAVNTMTLTINAAVVGALALVRRIDGATLKTEITLGPEVGQPLWSRSNKS